MSIHPKVADLLDEVVTSVYTVNPRITAVVGSVAYVDIEGLFRFDATGVEGKGMASSLPHFRENVRDDVVSVIERVVENSGLGLNGIAESLNDAMPVSLTRPDGKTFTITAAPATTKEN